MGFAYQVILRYSGGKHLGHLQNGLLPVFADLTQQMGKAIDANTVQFAFANLNNDFAAWGYVPLMFPGFEQQHPLL